MVETKRVVRQLSWIVLLCIVGGCLVSGASAATSENEAYVIADPVVQASSQYITCKAPCECWSEDRAYALWGANGYVKCDDRPCGGFPGESGKIYEYCYKKKPVTDVVIITTTTPVPAPVRMKADEVPPVRYGVQAEGGQEVAAKVAVPAVVHPGQNNQSQGESKGKAFYESVMNSSAGQGYRKLALATSAEDMKFMEVKVGDEVAVAPLNLYDPYYLQALTPNNTYCSQPKVILQTKNDSGYGEKLHVEYNKTDVAYKKVDVKFRILSNFADEFQTRKYLWQVSSNPFPCKDDYSTSSYFSPPGLIAWGVAEDPELQMVNMQVPKKEGLSSTNEGLSSSLTTAQHISQHFFSIDFFPIMYQNAANRPIFYSNNSKIFSNRNAYEFTLGNTVLMLPAEPTDLGPVTIKIPVGIMLTNPGEKHLLQGIRGDEYLGLYDKTFDDHLNFSDQTFRPLPKSQTQMMAENLLPGTFYVRVIPLGENSSVVSPPSFSNEVTITQWITPRPSNTTLRPPSITRLVSINPALATPYDRVAQPVNANDITLLTAREGMWLRQGQEGLQMACEQPWAPWPGGARERSYDRFHKTQDVIYQVVKYVGPEPTTLRTMQDEIYTADFGYYDQVWGWNDQNYDPITGKEFVDEAPGHPLPDAQFGYHRPGSPFDQYIPDWRIDPGFEFGVSTQVLEKLRQYNPSFIGNVIEVTPESYLGIPGLHFYAYKGNCAYVRPSCSSWWCEAYNWVTDALNNVVEFVNKVSSTFAELKSAVINVVAKYLPGCEGSPVCKTALRSALDYGLASLGVPPSIPSFNDLTSMGAEYLGSMAADQLGVTDVYRIALDKYEQIKPIRRELNDALNTYGDMKAVCSGPQRNALGIKDICDQGDEIKKQTDIFKQSPEGYGRSLINNQYDAMNSEFTTSGDSTWYTTDSDYSVPHPMVVWLRVWNPNNVPSDPAVIVITDSAPCSYGGVQMHLFQEGLTTIVPMKPYQSMLVPVMMKPDFDQIVNGCPSYPGCYRSETRFDSLPFAKFNEKSKLSPDYVKYSTDQSCRGIHDCDSKFPVHYDRDVKSVCSDCSGIINPEEKQRCKIRNWELMQTYWDNDWLHTRLYVPVYGDYNATYHNKYDERGNEIVTLYPPTVLVNVDESSSGKNVGDLDWYGTSTANLGTQSKESPYLKYNGSEKTWTVRYPDNWKVAKNDDKDKKYNPREMNNYRWRNRVNCLPDNKMMTCLDWYTLDDGTGTTDEHNDDDK